MLLTIGLLDEVENGFLPYISLCRDRLDTILDLRDIARDDLLDFSLQTLEIINIIEVFIEKFLRFIEGDSVDIDDFTDKSFHFRLTSNTWNLGRSCIFTKLHSNSEAGCIASDEGNNSFFHIVIRLNARNSSIWKRCENSKWIAKKHIF